MSHHFFATLSRPKYFMEHFLPGFELTLDELN